MAGLNLPVPRIHPVIRTAMRRNMSMRLLRCLRVQVGMHISLLILVSIPMPSPDLTRFRLIYSTYLTNPSDHYALRPQRRPANPATSLG